MADPEGAKYMRPSDPISFMSFSEKIWPGKTVADPGGGCRGAMAPPSPVEISHKKDGRQRRSHRFHVSGPPPTQPLDPMLENPDPPLKWFQLA